MGQIYLYSGVRGDLAPGTDQGGEGLKPIIARDHQSEVLFYHAPEKPELRCYFKAEWKSPEQCMAVYRGEGDWRQQVDDFRALVEERVRTTRGRLINDGSRNQIVYDRLRGDIVSEVDTAAIESELVAAIEENSGIPVRELDDLVEGLRKDGALDLRVPSAARAVDVLAYVRDRLGADWSVAISRSGRIETIDDADVVIVPDGSVDGVRLGETGDERIRKSAERTYKKETINQLGGLRELFNKQHENPGPAIASALNENGAPDQLDVYFTNGDNRSVLPSLRALKSGTKLAVGLGVLFFVGYYWPGVSNLSTKPVQARFSVPAEAPLLSVAVDSELWVWVIASLLVIGFVGLATSEWRRLLRRVLAREEGSGSSAGGQSGTAPSQDDRSTVDQHATAAVTELAKLRNLWDEEEYRKQLEEAVQKDSVTDLRFDPVAKRKRNRRTGGVLDAAAALVPVVLALAAVFLFGGRAVRFLDAEYVNVARVFVWGGIFFLVVFVIEVFWRTLLRGLSFTGGDDGRPAPEERLAQLRESFERKNTVAYFSNPSAYEALLDHPDEEIQTETAQLLRDHLDEQQVPERVEEILGPIEASSDPGTTLADGSTDIEDVLDPADPGYDGEGESPDAPNRDGTSLEKLKEMPMEQNEDGRIVRKVPTDRSDSTAEDTTLNTGEFGNALEGDENSVQGVAASSKSDSAYPSYRFGATNTGYSPGANRRGRDPSPRWPPEPFEQRLTAPVVGGGNVYVGAEDGCVLGFDVGNGNMDEIGEGDGQVRFPPVVDSDRELLYVVSTIDDRSTVYKYDLFGSEISKVDLKARASCPLAFDGSILVVGDEAGRVYKIDVTRMREPTTNTYLRQNGAKSVVMTPAIDEKRAYCVTSTNELYHLVWDGDATSIREEGTVKPLPPVWDEETQSLVIAARPSKLCRLSQNEPGSVDQQLVSSVSGPFSVADGVVYAALEDDRVVAVDMRQNRMGRWEPDGPEEWSVAIESWNGKRSVTVGGDTVYVAGDGVRAFDRANGSPLWHYEETNGGANPVAVVEGTVVVTDGSNTVHVLDV